MVITRPGQGQALSLPYTKLVLPGSEALHEWEKLSAQERSELLYLLEERFVVPRPIQLYVGDSSFTNETGVKVIKECIELEPTQWSYDHLVFLTTLWLWELSKIALTELNQSDLSFSLLWDFLLNRWQTYILLLGQQDVRPPDSLFVLASSLAGLRGQIEKSYIRCMRINGATWERREWFLPRSELKPDDIPPAFESFLEERLGMPLPDGNGYQERFRTLTGRLIAQGVNPTEALLVLADYTVTDPILKADYAIVTCARGVKLDKLWTIQLSDVMSYTAIRDAYDPVEHGVRLNWGQIRNAISQRMRFNVITRTRNFSPVREERMQAQSFQNPDICVMEDAHHNGHRANGVRFVARSPFLLDVPVNGEAQSLRGLADLRVNRASRRDEDQFTPEDLVRLISMSLWMKTVAEASISAGVLLDEKYCAMLDFYTDKDGGRVQEGKIDR